MSLAVTGNNAREGNDERVIDRREAIHMPIAGHGMVQGMAISPRAFMQSIHDDYLSETKSSLTLMPQIECIVHTNRHWSPHRVIS